MIPLTDRDGGRGQVGVETLVVFVAMILVAGLAATLLLSTAGYLQSGAEATSRDAGAQVTDRLLVTGATGTVDVAGEDRTIRAIELTVAPAPGANEYDLAAATVEVVGPDGHRTYRYGADGSDPDAFSVRSIDDGGDTAPVLASRGDRAAIRVPLADAPLAPGERATLRIVGPSGSRQTRIVSAPASLRNRDDGDVVGL